MARKVSTAGTGRQRKTDMVPAPQKLVIYTVLIGDKEPLNNPLRLLDGGGETDLDLDFVCFTDNPELTSPVWRFRAIPQRPMPPDRLSRLPKTMPHLVFPEAEFSLYMDNTVVFKRLPTSADLALEEGAVFRAFRHPWRSCPQDEADVVVRSALDDAARVAGQTRFYDTRRPLRDIRQLTAGTVLLRRHHDPRVRAFGEMWWEQILLFSARDQLSLDLCVLESGCPLTYFPGDKRNSDLILWPALTGPRRIEGSFDADRYAWDYRADPMARARPRAHYLAHGGGDRYQRRGEVFAYCCARANCGLNAQVPPRRALASLLEPLLAEIGSAANILVAGIASAASYAAAPEELDAARQALELYFRYGPPANTVTALVAADDIADPNPYRAAGGVAGFRLVVAIGMPPECHQRALAKFLPLLAEDGVLVMQFGDSLDLEMIRRMQDAAGPVTLSIFHGGHISRADAIASSVMVVRRA